MQEKYFCRNKIKENYFKKIQPHNGLYSRLWAAYVDLHENYAVIMKYAMFIAIAPKSSIYLFCVGVKLGFLWKCKMNVFSY